MGCRMEYICISCIIITGVTVVVCLLSSCYSVADVSSASMCQVSDVSNASARLRQMCRVCQMRRVRQMSDAKYQMSDVRGQRSQFSDQKCRKSMASVRGQECQPTFPTKSGSKKPAPPSHATDSPQTTSNLISLHAHAMNRHLYNSTEHKHGKLYFLTGNFSAPL